MPSDDFKIDGASSNGWTKPQRTLSLPEVRERIEELRKELSALEAEESRMHDQARLEAIVQIRNIMRANELDPSDLVVKRDRAA